MIPQNVEVLIVDGEQEFCETVARRLQRRGFSVTCDGPQLSGTFGTRGVYDVVLLRHGPTSVRCVDNLETQGRLARDAEIVVIATREDLETSIDQLPKLTSDILAKPLIWPELDWRIRRAADRVLKLREVRGRAQGSIANERGVAIDELRSISSKSLSGAGDALATVQRAHIIEILRREGGNKARTARALGVNRRSLYRLIEKFRIPLANDGAAEQLIGHKPSESKS